MASSGWGPGMAGGRAQYMAMTLPPLLRLQSRAIWFPGSGSKIKRKHEEFIEPGWGASPTGRNSSSLSHTHGQINTQCPKGLTGVAVVRNSLSTQPLASFLGWKERGTAKGPGYSLSRKTHLLHPQHSKKWRDPAWLESAPSVPPADCTQEPGGWDAPAHGPTSAFSHPDQLKKHWSHTPILGPRGEERLPSNSS